MMSLVALEPAHRADDRPRPFALFVHIEEIGRDAIGDRREMTRRQVQASPEEVGFELGNTDQSTGALQHGQQQELLKWTQ